MTKYLIKLPILRAGDNLAQCISIGKSRSLGVFRALQDQIAGTPAEKLSALTCLTDTQSLVESA